MKKLAVLLAGIFILLSAAAWAGEPEGVSPSGVDVAVVSNVCPTFSWSEVNGAASYKIQVYEMVTSAILTHDQMRAISQPVITNDTNSPALSWTPSLGQCLKDGVRYVWYVGARAQNTDIVWSNGKVFEVNLLSDSQITDAVKETVGNYLTNEWKKTESYTQVKEEITKDVTLSLSKGAQGSRGTLAYEGTTNTFYGQSAGQWTITNNAGTGPPNYNTFIGRAAGYNTRSGANYWDGDFNTFMGYYAGFSNTTGSFNTFIGFQAGTFNTTGDFNTFMGDNAGFSNTTGGGNVFLGYNAGYNETGSNKLYIANSFTANPLIYGDFSTGRIGIGMNNPQTKIDLGGGAITVNGNDTSAGVAPGQQRPQFGWTETGRAIMGWGGAGGANMEFYSRGHATRPGEYYIVYGGTPTTGKVLYAHYNGTTWSPALSMLHNGYIGLGTFTPSHPIHHTSGAYLSTGGVWTNASSRDYKDKIEDLKANEALEALKGLNPVKYIYKSNPEERHVGFIAEDVPALVATKDRKALSPMDIVAVLTTVVKEQQTEIEKLKSENSKYEERISKIEAQNKNLEDNNQALRVEDQQIKAELLERIAALERQLKLMNAIASR